MSATPEQMAIAAQYVRRLQIRKLGYASRPWRLVDPHNDKELYMPTSVTNGDGKTLSFNGPACFDRKRDAVAFLAQLHDDFQIPTPEVSHG